MSDVRHIGDEHLIGALVLIREIDRIFGDELSRQHPFFRVEGEALDDVQLVAMFHRRREHAGLEAHGVDDEHVALPAADRMPRVARRNLAGCSAMFMCTTRSKL